MVYGIIVRLAGMKALVVTKQQCTNVIGSPSRNLLAWSAVARSIHVAMILYVRILNAWRHVSAMTWQRWQRWRRWQRRRISLVELWSNWRDYLVLVAKNSLLSEFGYITSWRTDSYPNPQRAELTVLARDKLWTHRWQILTIIKQDPVQVHGYG